MLREIFFLSFDLVFLEKIASLIMPAAATHKGSALSLAFTIHVCVLLFSVAKLAFEKSCKRDCLDSFMILKIHVPLVTPKILPKFLTIKLFGKL